MLSPLWAVLAAAVCVILAGGLPTILALRLERDRDRWRIAYGLEKQIRERWQNEALGWRECYPHVHEEWVSSKKTALWHRPPAA